MRDILLGLLFLLGWVSIAGVLQAQVQRVDLQGLGVEEVQATFGTPDQKTASESGRETWSYGRSIILFREGKVSAWSDAGELSRRKNLAKVQNKDVLAEQERELWKNPWTPQQALGDRQVLQQLVSQAQKQHDVAQESKESVQSKRSEESNQALQE